MSDIPIKVLKEMESVFSKHNSKIILKAVQKEIKNTEKSKKKEKKNVNKC